MIQRSPALAFFMSFFLAPCSIAAGQASNEKDVWDMSLQDLLNLSVDSTTKSSISIQKAPGVVRAFSRREIEQYGFLTLRDLLLHVPGIQLDESRNGHTLVFIRGVQSRYNSKVLLLIDGVPNRDPFYGNFLIDEQNAMHNIEKVEVINGPGSVLYGANAFGGIISVTTRKSGNELNAYAAGDSTYAVSGRVSSDNWYAYGNYYKSDGFHPERNMDGSIYRHDQSASNKQVMLKYLGDKFTLIANLQDYEHPWTYRRAFNDSRAQRDPNYLAFKYNDKWNDLGSLNVLAYYSDYHFVRERRRFDAARQVIGHNNKELSIKMLGLDADFSWQMDSHALIAGVSFQQDFTGSDGVYEVRFIPEQPDANELAVDEETRKATAIFIQDLWHLNDEMILTTGLRYEVLSDFDNELNYRIALTGQKENGFYYKAMLGTAYRVPSYREYLDTAAFNFELEPEQMETLELQLGYLMKNGDMNLTLFRNDYTSFIKDLLVCSIDNGQRDYDSDCLALVETPDDRVIDDEYAVNANSRTLTGLEFNSTFYPNADTTLSVRATKLIETTEEIGQLDSDLNLLVDVQTQEQDLVYLSDFSFSLAAAHDFEQWRMSGSLHYFSARDVPDEYQTAVLPEAVNPANADAWTRVDAQVSYKFSGRTRAYIKINNLFDKAIYSQPFGGGGNYDSQWQGRLIRVGINHRF